MKKIYFLLLFTFIITFVFSKNSNDNNAYIKLQEKIEKLEYENNDIKKDYDTLIVQYQQTNDRLNNYLSLTGIVASVFGILIALAGIYIGFESLKSQNRSKDAIKTLEEAKKYVNSKKNEFDILLDDKKNLFQNEYDKISKILKEKLLSDIEIETSKVKEIAEKKTSEIQSYSIEQQNNKTIELLEKRLDFFENIGIPDDPEILFSKAKILREKKMYNESILLFEKLVEKSPSHKDAYWFLGYDYGEIKNNDKSIENYKKQLEINPNDSSALNNMALQFQGKGNLLEAVECLNKAILISNKKELYYTNRIDILKNLNSNERIIENYIELISINIDKVEYYKQLIYYLKKEGRNADAALYFDKAINHFKENDHETSKSFEFSKALFLGEINKEQEAIEVFQNLIDNNYDIENCYINIADLKNKLGKTEEALKILDNGISNNPLASILYAYKAFIEANTDEKKSKLTIDKGGTSINTENFYFIAGRFFNQKGNLLLAKYCYDGALRIIETKLTKDKIEEGDLMNYYETLIILQKPLKDFNEKYHSLIITEKNLIIMAVLDIFNELYNNYSNDKKNATIEKIKNLNIEAKNKDLVVWNFEDITKFIETKNKNELSIFTKNLIGYIQQKIKLEDL